MPVKPVASSDFFKSEGWVEADRKASYTPVISTLVGVVNLVSKAALYIASFFVDKETIYKNHYFKHIEEKSTVDCFKILLPFAGNFAILYSDGQAKQKALKGLESRKKSLHDLPVWLQMDKEIAMQAVKADGNQLQYVIGELKNDWLINLYAIKQNPEAFAFVQFKSDADFMRIALRIDRNLDISQLSEPIFKIREEIIEDASPRTPKEQENILKKMHEEPLFLLKNAGHLYNTREFLEAALKIDAKQTLEMMQLFNSPLLQNSAFMSKNMSQEWEVAKMLPVDEESHARGSTFRLDVAKTDPVKALRSASLEILRNILPTIWIELINSQTVPSKEDLQRLSPLLNDFDWMTSRDHITFTTSYSQFLLTHFDTETILEIAGNVLLDSNSFMLSLLERTLSLDAYWKVLEAASFDLRGRNDFKEQALLQLASLLRVEPSQSPENRVLSLLEKTSSREDYWKILNFASKDLKNAAFMGKASSILAAKYPQSQQNQGQDPDYDRFLADLETRGRREGRQGAPPEDLEEFIKELDADD